MRKLNLFTGKKKKKNSLRTYYLDPKVFDPMPHIMPTKTLIRLFLLLLGSHLFAV